MEPKLVVQAFALNRESKSLATSAVFMVHDHTSLKPILLYELDFHFNYVAFTAARKFSIDIVSTLLI